MNINTYNNIRSYNSVNEIWLYAALQIAATEVIEITIVRFRFFRLPPAESCGTDNVRCLTIERREKWFSIMIIFIYYI